METLVINLSRPLMTPQAGDRVREVLVRDGVIFATVEREFH